MCYRCVFANFLRGDRGTVTLDQLNPECGVAVNEHFWLNELHPTYPVHDATAAHIVEDCFGKHRAGYCS